MGTKLLILFLLVILAYVIAIILQKLKGRKNVKLHMNPHERDKLIDEIEAIEILALESWKKADAAYADDSEVNGHE